MTRLLLNLLILTMACLAQLPPSISVQHPTGSSAIVPYRTVAPGSLVIIGGAPIPADPDPSRYTVKLRPQGGGELRAQVLRTMPNLLALLPSDLPLGLMQVVLESPGQTSTPINVRVVRSAFGFFSTDGVGMGQAIAQIVRPDHTEASNRLTNPARPGDYLILWGTGLGPARVVDVVVEIGGIPVTPAYAGPAPGNPGLDQVNVLLPPEAPRGCYTSVLLRAGDAVSNEVNVATAEQSGACELPFGLGESELLALDQGQWVPLARAMLRSEIMPVILQNLYTRHEEAIMEFRGDILTRSTC